MNKTVKNVFMLIGVLVAIFLAWQLIFNDGGILKTAYNAICGGINKQWAKVAGDGEELIPKWGDNADDNGKGFDIDTSNDGGTATGG